MDKLVKVFLKPPKAKKSKARGKVSQTAQEIWILLHLLDYKKKWEELEEDENPFAVVVMAHLQSQETRHTYPAEPGKPEERFEFKWKLIRSLYERGYRKEDIRKLFR